MGSNAAGRAGRTWKLIVEDRGFEGPLDEARSSRAPHLRASFAAAERKLGWKSWLTIAVVTLPLAWSLYVNLLPRAHVFVSREAEARLGDSIHDALVEGEELLRIPGLDALIARMVSELVDPEAGFDVRVTVLRSDTPNALALPGGRVLVFSELLRSCPTQDALAAVLAHEIVHVEERHGLKQMLRSAGLIAFASELIGGGAEELCKRRDHRGALQRPGTPEALPRHGACCRPLGRRQAETSGTPERWPRGVLRDLA